MECSFFQSALFGVLWAVCLPLTTLEEFWILECFRSENRVSSWNVTLADTSSLPGWYERYERKNYCYHVLKCWDHTCSLKLSFCESHLTVCIWEYVSHCYCFLDGPLSAGVKRTNFLQRVVLERMQKNIILSVFNYWMLLEASVEIFFLFNENLYIYRRPVYI